MSIKQNIDAIRKRVSIAQSQSADSSAEIIIVCVTKNRSFDEICQALNAGIVHIGESKIQEAQNKINALRDYVHQKNIACNFHMIGHLQTNKVVKALGMFDMIQSIDSLKLCKKINELSRHYGRIRDVLIEVNTSKEASKFGVSVEGLIPFLRDVSKFDSVRVRGLMTLAPYNNDKETARPFFRVLRNARDQINAIQKREEDLSHVTMDFLSMGMSGDFEIAVQEGANMVRIGSAIFEGVQ